MQSTQSQLKLKIWQGSKKNYDRLLTYKELEVGTIYFVGDNATFGTSKTGIIYIAVSKDKSVLFGAFDMAQLSQKVDEIERLLYEANGDIDRLIAEVSRNTEKLATIEEGAEKNKINAIERNGQAITPSEDKVINILIPIKTSELTNDSEYQTSADVAETIIGVDLNIASGIITLTRKNGTTFTIDLPTEKIIKSGYYDSEKEEIVMVLADDSEIRFSASQLIDEYYADNVTLEQYTDTADGNKKKFRLTTSYKNKVDGAEQVSNKTASVTSASTATQYPSALAVWNAIKNFATSVQTFTTASTRENIESGETISTIFGKIRKWLADLKAVAFSGSYNDLSDKPSIGNGTITIKQKGVEKGSFSMNQTGNATIELTDENTTYGIATSSAAGLVKSGGNITVASDGAVTVNNASIANELKVNYFNGTFYGGSSSSGKTDGYLRICRFKRNSAQRESSMAIRIMWEFWGVQKFGGVTVNFFQNSQGQNYFMGYLSEYTQMGSVTTRATSARFYYRTSGDYVEIYAYCTRGNGYGSWIFSTIQFDGGFDPPQSYYLQDVDVSSMALTELSVFQTARYDLEGNAISTTYAKLSEVTRGALVASGGDSTGWVKLCTLPNGTSFQSHVYIYNLFTASTIYPIDINATFNKTRGFLISKTGDTGNVIKAYTNSDDTATIWVYVRPNDRVRVFLFAGDGVTMGGTGQIPVTSITGTEKVFDEGNSESYVVSTNNIGIGLDYLKNAIGYSGPAAVSNLWGSQTDCAIYQQVYSDKWQHQILADYRTGQLYLRAKNNGTWQTGRYVIDQYNLKDYCINVTSVGSYNWINTTNDNKPITSNTLAYWNGAYNTANSSNLQKLGYELFLNGTKALRNASDGWLRINDEKTFSLGTFFGTGLVRTDGNFRVGPNADTALDVTQSKFTWKGVNVATVNSTVAKADGLRGGQRYRNNYSRYVEMGRITVPTGTYHDKGFSVLIKGQHNTNIGDAYIFNVCLSTGASASSVSAKIFCAMASRTNYNEVLVGELTSTHLILYFDCVLQNYTAWAWSILNDADGEFVPSSGNTYVASIPSSGGTKVAQENNMLAVKDGSGNTITSTYATKTELTDGSVTKVGTATLGSTTEPIYLSSGVPTTGSTYAGGTRVTLNSTSMAGSTATFYAPTNPQSAGWMLVSNGKNSAPVFKNTLQIGSGTTNKNFIKQYGPLSFFNILQVAAGATTEFDWSYASAVVFNGGTIKFSSSTTEAISRSVVPVWIEKGGKIQVDEWDYRSGFTFLFNQNTYTAIKSGTFFVNMFADPICYVLSSHEIFDKTLVAGILEITDSNLSTYYNSGTEVLSGISNTIDTILINCSSRIKIGAIQMTDVFNGKRVSLIGEFVPSERYSFYNDTISGGFSSYLYTHRPGSPNSSLTNDTVIRGYEDFIYFNGKWYGKGY